MRDRKNTACNNFREEAYAEKLLKIFSVLKCNLILTPLPVDANIELRRQDKVAIDIDDHHRNQSLVGGLAYLAHCTSLDLIVFVSALSRDLQVPAHKNHLHEKRLCRSLSRTVSYGLVFPVNVAITTTGVRAAVGAHCRGCKDTQNSTTGFVFAVNATPTHGKSRNKH